MTIFRVLTLVAVVALPLAGPLREHLGALSSARTALALIGEALELCRGSDDNPTPEPGSLDAAARSAAGAEALVAATEVGRGIADQALGQTIVAIADELANDCGPVETPASRGGEAVNDGARSATERAHSRDQMKPYLSRLNAAALRAVEARERLAGNAAAEESAPRFERSVRPVHDDGAAASEDVVGAPSSIGSAATAPNAEVPQTPELRLEIGPSEAYSQRVAEWSRMFRREAATLETARRALQVEIDRHSLIEARGSCREFGRLLDRLDADLARAAPSRELSVRVERMLGRYRRGVAECVAGKTAASYGFLSEGDREWSALVRAAAPVLAPRWSPDGGAATQR